MSEANDYHNSRMAEDGKREAPKKGPLLDGYRQLSPDEIELANEVKRVASFVGLLVDRLQARQQLDQRWVSVGKTELQQGFMALVRSITRPTTF
jgi:hypothetical protein